MVGEYVAKSRTYGYRSETGRYWSPSVRSYTYTSYGYQFTTTRGNPAWKSYKTTGEKSSRSDMGGSFLTIVREPRMGLGRLTGSNGYPSNSFLYEAYDGWVIPYWHAATTGNWVANVSELAAVGQPGRYNPPWSVDLESKGATAVSRCAPTNPHADLLVSLAELRNDGIKSALPTSLVKGAERGAVRSSADDYLSLQFGALPLISDLRRVHSAIRDKTRILQQYARDSGKLIRRTYRFPTDSSTTTVPVAYQVNPSSGGGPVWWANPGTTSQTTTITRDVWFKGAFTYHRATGDSALSRLTQDYQDLNHLLGLGVGPSTAWNLLPWSWAVDWFTNTGDIMKNAQMFMNDGLIMDYGYVMQTETIQTSWTRSGCTFLYPGYKITWSGAPWTCGFYQQKKERRPANPFGFGITYESLSSRQMSILAALGITKSARTP